MENENKSAKVLVTFLIAIFAFGISNCIVLLLNGFIVFDLFNPTEDTNDSLNIFDPNKNTSPQNYQNNSNTK
ncbi:MAG: hypothetical protein LBU74_04360 [Methanobacteriaceae archaeon]|nr:hypothetical protein [Candidatus Methanorudis spinitermitis]